MLFARILFVLAIFSPMVANAFVITGDKFGDAALGTSGGVVTWSLAGTGPDCGDVEVGGSLYVGSCTHLSEFMPAGFVSEIEAAFAAWSSVANIDFVQIADGGGSIVNETAAQIRISGHIFDGLGGTLAHAFYPGAQGAGFYSDVHFDMEEQWQIGFGGTGFDIFQVLAHEIGHAIGLQHTNVANSLLNPYYTESFLGLQADDIAGAQFIYGIREAIAEVSAPASLFMSLCLLGFVVSRRRA